MEEVLNARFVFGPPQVGLDAGAALEPREPDLLTLRRLAAGRLELGNDQPGRTAQDEIREAGRRVQAGPGEVDEPARAAGPDDDLLAPVAL